MLLIFFCFNSIIIFCIYFYKSDGEMVFKVVFKICEMVLYFINIDVVFGCLY